MSAFQNRAKITDIAEMEKLYQEGKINSVTLWRGKKRGYIMPNYHKKVKHDKNPTIEQNIYKLLGIAYKTSFRFCRVYLKDGYIDNVEIIGADIAQDVMLYILEVQPEGGVERLVGIVKKKVREYATRKPLYSRYFSVERIEKSL